MVELERGGSSPEKRGGGGRPGVTEMEGRSTMTLTCLEGHLYSREVGSGRQTRCAK